MGQINFCCQVCGGNKFIFTTYNKKRDTQHGAVCSKCKTPLTTASFSKVNIIRFAG